MRKLKTERNITLALLIAVGVFGVLMFACACRSNATYEASNQAEADIDAAWREAEKHFTPAPP